MYWNEHRIPWWKYEGSRQRKATQVDVNEHLLREISSQYSGVAWNVLDIGCWTWTFLSELAYILPDFSLYWVDKLFPFPKQVQDQRFSVKKNDIELWIDYKDSEFLLCVSKFMIMYLEDLWFHFSEVSRIIKQDGEYFVVTLNPEYTLEKQRQVNGLKDISYWDEVTHEIIWAGIKVKLILHSPSDYEDAIGESWFSLVSKEQLFHPKPRFEFARYIPFADILRLKKS